MRHLSFRSSLEQYRQQAEQLLKDLQSGDPGALQDFKQWHPKVLDVRDAGLDIADAHLTVARAYDFRDWAALEEFVAGASKPDSPVARFEAAVDAVVDGDLQTLTLLMNDHPELATARST